jgi:hypothetical protein
MDNDPCSDQVLFSVLNSAGPDLTLAGVLAGFLIAVVAALVVQWYDQASPRMIALFASGVPALMLSGYLFTISSGAKPPAVPKNVAELTGPNFTGELVVPSPSPSNLLEDLQAHTTNYCNQVWSQWLPAFAELLIGGAVLLCGLGWALVIYGERLADRLKGEKLPKGTIDDYHRFFIRLNALLSLCATIGMAGLLIAANVTYLTATTHPKNITDPNKTLAFWEYPHGVYWYAMFLVFLFGVYVVAGSLYLVLSRTASFAWGEHVPGVHTKSCAPRRAWGNKRVRRVAREIGIVLVVVGGALFAGYLTKKVLGDDFSGHWINYAEVVAAAYAIGRLAYSGIVLVQQYAAPDAKISVAPSTKKPRDAIQLRYSSGGLRVTSYHVVVFALLGAALTAVVTNAPLWKILGSWQTGLALFTGGLYPACILLGLSYSVPADPSFGLPKWKTRPVPRFLP